MGKNLLIIIVIALFVGLVASSITVVYALKGTSSSNSKHIVDIKPFVKSVKDFVTSLSPIVNENPEVENSVNTTTTNSTTTSEVNIKVNDRVIIPPKTYCIDYKIDSGEFASNNCYSEDDYYKLLGYLANYNNAKAMVKAEKDSMDFTCDGWSDIFKKACEESKASKKKYESNVEKYRSLILNLIR